MIFKVERIVRDVRVAIDENGSDSALLREADTDTLSLDEVIWSKIEDAARRVEMAAPVELLEAGCHLGDGVFWGEHGEGWIILPDDFMRLIAFKMSDWERAVHHAIPATDPRYALQSSRVMGLRGNPQRPVCAVVMRPEGRVLEFYSCAGDDATVERGVYLPYPCMDADGGIDISGRCYRSVVYMVASLVLHTIGEPEQGARMAELSEGCL